MIRKVDISQKRDFCLKDIMVLPYRNYHVMINVQDIIYFKAEKAYSRLFLHTGEEFMVSRNIKYIKDKLPTNFIRTHNSYVINVLFATSMIDYNAFVLANQQQVPISRRRVKEILMNLNLF